MVINYTSVFPQIMPKLMSILEKKLRISASPDEDEEDSIIELKNNDKQEVEELVFRLNRIAKNCKSIS